MTLWLSDLWGRMMLKEVNVFVWYARPDDFDEFGNLHLNISAGRLRHRWVPTTKASAIRYLRHHPDAAGLRAAHTEYLLVSINMTEEGVIEDLSSDYQKAIVGGLRGVVIRTPIDELLPKFPSKGAIKRGTIAPPMGYKTGSTDMIKVSEPKHISSVEMGLLTPDEIRDMSVLEVISASGYSTAGEQEPIRGGIQDQRMGTVDEKACTTCERPRLPEDAANSCPGHFGRVTLVMPVPKLAYLGFNGRFAKGTYPILNCLNSVCHSCGEIKVPVVDLQGIEGRVESVFEQHRRNFRGYLDIRRLLHGTMVDYHGDEGRPCPHCQEFTPKLKFEHGRGQFTIPVPDDRYLSGAKGIDYRTAHEILKKIRDEQCKFLGMDFENSRPENLFFTILPIAPNTVRPSKSIPGVPLKELDELTKLYQDVISVNETLRDIVIRKQVYYRESLFATKLYHAVSRVYDNQRRAIGSGGTSMVRGFSGAEKYESYKGIMNRFTGKEGRFRANLQSKSVEEVSYSIITADPRLALDEVGVPIKIAMKATVMEVVTKDNFAKMKMLLGNGPKVYPGANLVIVDGDPSNKEKSNYRELDGEDSYIYDKVLLVGSIVKRHVMDGDYGLFNRAPSLHRQSILALRSRIIESEALTFNPSICIPFNADYDGDAMKMHFVQSPEAQDEAKRLMALDKNLIHARYGKLTVATDQDQTSGLYLLTHTDKRRIGEWSGRLGFNDEGIPYVSKAVALECYTYVYSEMRDEKELRKLWLKYKREVPGGESWKEWSSRKHYRTVDTLPESDQLSPTGEECYTGRALFSHLFTVTNSEYVSATFIGNTPKVDGDGEIIRSELKNGLILDPDIKKTTKDKERVIVYNGKLIQGTLEKDSFGEGGSSLAPSFFYHEGYEGGHKKLTEYIEMMTRLGYAGHSIIGYTMGPSDVGLYNPEIIKDIDDMYNMYSEEISKLQKSWNDGTYYEHADIEDEKIAAVIDPAGWLNEKIVNLASEYEDRILEPIENEQGAGNAMQIAVRSRARGKDLNVRQMGGSFGMVLVGGNRITTGISRKRVLPHFPLMNSKGEVHELTHPKHVGFVKSGYSTGMNPTEYWLTSTAGRRSTVESGQGNVALSGYLERKMIKAMEPVVVNNLKQCINTRTGRVLSPLIGDDGLAPYHIRGSHEDVNSDGLVITLQPLLFEFECKHGKPLEDNHVKEYPEHACLECSKGSNIPAFDAELSSLGGVDPSKSSADVLRKVLSIREMTLPNTKKMARRFHQFYQDSLCRTGEAIGATAGSCLGEPATQSSLRTFHFAGKMSFQGSVKRTRQILESPLSKSIDIDNPRTLVPLKEGMSEDMANKVAAVCRIVKGEHIISLISYDVPNMSLIIQFNSETFRLFRLDGATDVVWRQLKKTVGSLGQMMTKSVHPDEPFVIKINSTDTSDLLRTKESILSTEFSGIGGAQVIYVIKEDRFPGRWVLDIRDASSTTLTDLSRRMGKYLDTSILQTNNIQWIHQHFGLEAALWQIEQELYFQMNGKNGVGEYDYRYVRTICDLMGEEGTVSGLGPQGMGSYGNYSVLSACSLERIPEALTGGSVMGNFDNLQGAAEAIVAGSTVPVGDYVPKS